MPWAKRNTRTVPRISSPSREYESNDYSAGMNSQIANDKFVMKSSGPNMWRLAQNARITTLGQYDSRKGFDYLTDAASEASLTGVSSVVGASNQTFDENTWLAQKWTSTQTTNLTKITVNIRNAASHGTGTILVEHWTDSGGSPGVLVSRSSIASSDLSTSYAYLTARFPDAPAIVNGTAYWVVVNVQPAGTTGYSWSSTTSATTAKKTTDGGGTWNTTTFALNCNIYYSISTKVIGLYRAVKSDGTKRTLFVQGTILYSADDAGTVTVVKTGLSSSATSYRFWMVNDIVYYVNGYDGYRKWNFTTESQVNATNYTDLIVHKNLMFLVRADDPTRVDISGIGLYETFASTDFLAVPSPKTADPIRALTSLNGYLLVRTLNRCFIISGSETTLGANGFTIDAAPDQKGTVSPECSVNDKNYVYFLSDDGVYRSNGTQPELLSENIYKDIVNLANKQNCCMAVAKGRLYLWFTSDGASYNDSCYVWNLNYKTSSDTVESLDTTAYVSRVVTSHNDQDELIVGSSIIGQIYWQELASNDHNNLGAPIDFQLQTHYMIASSPAVYKEIRYWNPRFAAQDDNYTIACDFATDLRNNWQTQGEPDVQGVGSIWGASSMIWGSFSWGASAEVTTQLYVPGEYRRIAVRYKHYAARQPQQFLGHTFRIQERRLR